jgi:hypothetical protein
MKKYLLFTIIIFIFQLLLCEIIIQDEMTKIFNVTKGESGNGYISVYNQSLQNTSIKITQADYTYNEQGESFFLEPGKFYRSNSTWIKAPSTLMIPAGRSVQIPFTFSTPNNNTLIGSYWSILLIEEEHNYADFVPADFYINYRYSIQIIHNIKGTGNIDIEFGDLNFMEDFIALTLKNTGSLWVEANVKIDIYDENTAFIGSYTSEGERIYPDLSQRIVIPYKPLNKGSYYAVIVTDCGNNRIFGNQTTFLIR